MQILLLEDDIDLGQAVAEHLEAAGHGVHWCKLLAQAPGAAGPPDLALLDLNLPDGDGLDLLRAWRSAGLSLPVLVLTARDQISDRVRGLRAGADDYLVKPFDLDEMLARVEALWRRGRPLPLLQLGDLTLDLGQHVARREGLPVELTAMEWALLAVLAAPPGRICPRGQLEEALAPHQLAQSGGSSLEVMISRLRKKLGARRISTHRGLGYRFER
ncbi:MAG: response regulator transcription factor [Burkholderiaceae bacterium]|nr:response regulator transcription factor [Burkholderiaceae bacterium]MBT9499727.1 response regulator transcription factor [Burkholderiaceae bacterium]